MQLIKLDDCMGGYWCIIELQGKLESRSHTDLKGKFIGDLFYKKNNDSNVFPDVCCIIGHHILMGKIQKMGKPMAVLKKTQNKDFIVKAVITHKIIFKARPKPMCSTSTLIEV